LARILQPPFFFAALNRLRWFFRWPIKWAIFGIVYVIVCFPYPRLVFRHLQHWNNPNALIEPDAPALQPLASELRSQMPVDLPPPLVLKYVEAFVYEHVLYDWDWNTWGMADYLPTVAEVIRMGHEDCDGRAVIAASLLKNLGYDARIVTDFAHVWVWTPQGETMGPGKTKTVEVTDKGLRLNARGLLQIPEILAYGIAVFPWQRELVLVIVFWLLLMGRARIFEALIALALMIGGLLLVRHGGADYRGPRHFIEMAGLVVFVFGVLFLVLGHRIVLRPARFSQPDKTVSAGNPV
jgi:hypothetical protein